MRILFALTSCLALLACARATPAPLRVDGLVAATFTPFKDDAARTFNPDLIASYVEWLNSTGVGYVFVSGTTGESVKLTTEERLVQAKMYVDEVKKFPGMKVIVHVGAECLADAVRMAQNAESIGADAIASMPPSFFKPATVQAPRRI